MSQNLRKSKKEINIHKTLFQSYSYSIYTVIFAFILFFLFIMI